VSLKQEADKTCLMCVGVDEHDTVYVLPDLVWKHMSADQTVEAMIRMMRAHKPVFWWAERSQVSKSIGPFLQKADAGDEDVLFHHRDAADRREADPRAVHPGPHGDGQGALPRARGLVAGGAGPTLKFPYDAHDDFVDALAYIGLGLMLQVAAYEPRRHAPKEATEGTFGWLKMQREQAERSVKLGYATGGF
jgi:hypothetical protein